MLQCFFFFRQSQEQHVTFKVTHRAQCVENKYGYCTQKETTTTRKEKPQLFTFCLLPPPCPSPQPTYHCRHLMKTLCWNRAFSLVATSVPLAALLRGVSATSELMLNRDSLPQGDQMDRATSSCLV